MSKMEYVTLDEVYTAYTDCRKHKRNTFNAVNFEINAEDNCVRLWRELNNGTYQIGKSIAFIVNYPVKREIFAADFRDRVVHHLIYNKLNGLFEDEFIEDCYSCRVGKGTYYGYNRVYHFVNECSLNYTKSCYILKLDIQSFFMSIDKMLLFDMLRLFMIDKYSNDIDKNFWINLVRQNVLHQPQKSCIIKGSPKNWDGLSYNKSLFNVGEHKGLAIGNLTSQVFANFYMNKFDHFVKDTCGIQYYGRYVDDFIIVHEDKNLLLSLIPRFRKFLKDELMLTLHPNKLYLQHYTKGVKFIGTVINPYRKYIGNRTKGNLYRKVHEFNNKISKDNAPDLVATVNSYLGFMKYHSSYNIRKDVLVNKLDSRWKEFITISPDYLKINLKK
jgi:RNA-directed DNA polymerase